MKKTVFATIVISFTLLVFLTPIPVVQANEWPGVDESVVEKFADEAGYPARDPYINTDQGDLLLFVFAVAGVAGGFAMGYFFRALFPPKPRNAKGKPD